MANQRVQTIKSVLPPMSDGEDRLILDTMRYEEMLGQPFTCVVAAMSQDHSIDADKLLGTSLTVISEPKKGKKRFINGIVTELSYAGVADGYSRYRIVTRPWLWLLKHTTDCRIFQEKSVTEIFTDVCKETHSFSDYRISTQKTLTKRDYCVQYRESDFDFISRLLQEEGIYYFIEHEEDKHQVVLVDSGSSHRPTEDNPKIPFRLPGDAPNDMEFIFQWTTSSQLKTTEVATRSFDFEKPLADSSASAKVSRKHKQAKFEKYDYPGGVAVRDDAEQLVKSRMQHEQSDAHEYLGACNKLELTVGRHFQMLDHPRKDQNKVDYLVKNIILEVVAAEVDIFSDRQPSFEASFTAIPLKQPFSPALTTPRPRVSGPQSAFVVGAKGKEIWTDKYGRVKVQFHWDREGKKDENSSCWVRVSQTWAGNGWGSMHIPRVGQEVLVDFLDGDPDCPIITGRVYNADHETPYTLPDNQTQSGIKSRSTEKGKPANFNELRFEDKFESEEIYLHAERDFNQVVENDYSLKVGLDKKSDGDQNIEIHHNRNITVNTGDETITVQQGNRETTVDQGDETITIKQGDRTVKASAGKQTFRAGQSIELIVGGSSIKIESAKVTIKSPEIVLQASGTLKAESPMTTVSGSGMLTLKGGLVKIN